MQNKVRNGGVSVYTNSSTDLVKGGDILVMGPAENQYVGIAVTDIALNGEGMCELCGIFRLPKGNSAFAQGTPVYLDETGLVSDTGTVFVGRVEQSAETAETVVEVRLNFLPVAPVAPATV